MGKLQQDMTRKQEQERRQAGFVGCRKCNRITGIKYIYPDGHDRAISLRKDSKGYVCADCRTGIKYTPAPAAGDGNPNF